MKKAFKMLLIAGSMSAGFTAYAQDRTVTEYGEKFEIKEVHTMQSLADAIAGKKELKNIELEGMVSEVCQAEGCWIKLDNHDGDDIMVKFKDHAFTVPKDVAGKSAIVKGNAIRKTVSVKELKHLAEDAGATKEEIEAITEPQETVMIEATGISLM